MRRSSRAARHDRPIDALTGNLRESRAALHAVWANRGLRRLVLALAGWSVGHWAFLVGVSVVVFGERGAGAVGVMWLARSLATAAVSPLAGVLADRHRRDRLLLATEGARFALMAATAAAVLAGAGAWTVVALVTLAAVAAAPIHPATEGLLPDLARTPEELVAGNVAVSAIESAGYFLGPALAGVLLAAGSPSTVLVVTAAAALWPIAWLAGVHAPAPEPARPGPDEGRELLAGFRTIGREPSLRVVVVLLTATTFVDGALEVLAVVVAVDLLGMGNQGVGYLNAAFGAGAVLGVGAALALVGARRLHLPFLAGVLLWGLPLVGVAALPRPWLALALFAVVGFGNTLLEVAGTTLIQRSAPPGVLSRVAGVMQALWMTALGVGAVAAPPLVSAVGARWTLLAVGCFLPVLVGLLGRRLAGAEAAATLPDEARLALVSAHPLFAPLPETVHAALALRAVELVVEPGAVLIRQGDAGDRFYLLAAGEAEVDVDGAPVATLRAGDGCGEIALLRDTPRTATVTARSRVVALALEREDFLGAVRGFPAALDRA